MFIDIDFFSLHTYLFSLQINLYFDLFNLSKFHFIFHFPFSSHTKCIFIKISLESDTYFNAFVLLLGKINEKMKYIQNMFYIFYRRHVKNTYEML